MKIDIKSKINRGRTGNQNISQALRHVDKLKLKLPAAKTGLGRALNSMRQKSFAKMKLNTYKDIAKNQQNVLTRGIGAAGEIAKTMIATDTAKELANPNSYKNSLAAWTKNIAGNPDKASGNEGETQSGSTSELGG